MFWNYLKVAYRNLLRHWLYAAINVVGLGIAISFCLLAFLYVRHEWTYDAFHKNADRIYRVYAVNDRGRSMWRRSGRIGAGVGGGASGCSHRAN